MNVVTEGVVFGLFFGHERRPKQPKANLNDAFTDLRHFLESPGRAQFGSGNKMALKDLVDRTLLGNITKRAASAHFGIGNSRVVDQNFLFRRRLLRTLPFFACFLFLCV